MLIVRGVKHFPQDLEETIEHSSQLVRPGCCAVFTVPGPAGDLIGVAAEIDAEAAGVTRAGEDVIATCPRSCRNGARRSGECRSAHRARNDPQDHERQATALRVPGVAGRRSSCAIGDLVHRRGPAGGGFLTCRSEQTLHPRAHRRLS